MVTTSGNLVAGEAINGQGGGGNGRFNLKAKLALGVALLGCAGALAFGGLRATSEAPSQAATGASAASSTYQVWAGPCRAGSSECLPDEDFLATVPAEGGVALDGSCAAASAAAVPGEGCATALPTAGVGLREYLDNETAAMEASVPGLAMLPPSLQDPSA